MDDPANFRFAGDEVRTLVEVCVNEVDVCSQKMPQPGGVQVSEAHLFHRFPDIPV